jgi:nucleotide-binding universal stress UspA family protein
MTGWLERGDSVVRSVFHASDFSQASRHAFAHALVVALIRQTKFTILNVGAGDDSSWTQFPAVRQTLEQWGLLAPGSDQAAVFDQLAVRVRKVALKGRKPLPAMVEFLNEEPSDLLVLATRKREGLPGWLDGETALPLTHSTGTPALLVPEDGRGWVNPDTGRLGLRRILVPVDHDPIPAASVLFASRAAAALGDGGVEIVLLHVGEGVAPELDLPADPAWSFRRIQRRGDVTDTIIQEAEDLDAEMIVMTSAGRRGLVEALRGSTLEQVVRRAPCTVLAMPAHEG